MATRYGRRAADGTFEYHDSKESLQEAVEREERESNEKFREDLAGLFGLIGLIAGGWIAYSMLGKFGAEWPKWLRFALVIAGGGTLAYVLAKLTGIICNTIKFCISLAILSGMGLLLWSLANLLWKAV